MSKPKPRRVRSKRTVYDITVKPTNTIILSGPKGPSLKVNAKKISIRGRKRPRKARLALINWFNDLVEKRVISNVKFDKNGCLSYEKSKFSRNLTDREVELLKKVRFVTREPTIREKVLKGEIARETKIGTQIDRLEAAMKEHERKGQFDYIDSGLESTIMEGESTDFLFLMGERTTGQNYDSLKRKIAGYDKKRVQTNLRKQLRYFQAVLKAKKKKQMVIGAEKMKIQEEITVVKLEGKKVIRETTTDIYSYRAGDIYLPAQIDVHRVILWPNGKITFETTDYETPNHSRHRF